MQGNQPAGKLRCGSRSTPGGPGQIEDPAGGKVGRGHGATTRLGKDTVLRDGQQQHPTRGCTGRWRQALGDPASKVRTGGWHDWERCRAIPREGPGNHGGSGRARGAGEAAGVGGRMGGAERTRTELKLNWGRVPEIYPEDALNIRLFNKKMKAEEEKLNEKFGPILDCGCGQRGWRLPVPDFSKNLRKYRLPKHKRCVGYVLPSGTREEHIHIVIRTLP